MMKRSSLSILRNIASLAGSSSSSRLAAPTSSYSTLIAKTLPSKPFSDSTFSLRSPLHARSFSYYSLQENEMEEQWKKICKEYTDGGEPEVIVDPPNLVTVENGEDFKTFLSKAKDESLPAVFYYTSLSSAPCRVILPMVRELSKRIPDITSYKIDKDQEGVQSTLEEFNVSIAPHLNFFIRGKKVGELIVPDTKNLLETLQTLCDYYISMKKVIAIDNGEATEESFLESNGESVPESTEEDVSKSDEESAAEPTRESSK